VFFYKFKVCLQKVPEQFIKKHHDQILDVTERITGCKQ